MVSHSPHFPSRLKFGSFLVYPSPAVSAAEKAAKASVLHVKRAAVTQNGPIIDIIADRLVARLPGSVLADMLNGTEILVPMPGSAQRLKNAVWSAESICHALVSRGLAKEVRPYIERAKPIRKSAWCAMNNIARPSPREHYDSMQVRKFQGEPESVLLVDDVITKGATFFGAAAHLLENFPDIDMRAFAIAHTENGMTDFIAPCDGWIICPPDGSWSKRNNTELPKSGSLF